MDRQILEGIIETPGITSESAFKITPTAPTATRRVSVMPGGAYVRGSEQGYQGMYHVFNDDDYDINLVLPDMLNPRIDLVYLRVYDSEVLGNRNEAVVEVLTGTPSSNPQVPILPASSISLAQVRVPAGASEISSTDITDTRPIAKFYTGLSAFLTTKPGPWISASTPTNLFKDTWRQYGGDWQQVQYRKFNGMTELRGLAQSTARIQTNTYSNIIQLPVGYRAQAWELMPAVGSGIFQGGSGTQSSGTAHTHPYGESGKAWRMEARTDGNIFIYMGHGESAYQHYTSSPTPWVSFNGIMFPSG